MARLTIAGVTAYASEHCYSLIKHSDCYHLQLQVGKDSHGILYPLEYFSLNLVGGVTALTASLECKTIKEAYQAIRCGVLLKDSILPLHNDIVVYEGDAIEGDAPTETPQPESEPQPNPLPDPLPADRDWEPVEDKLDWNHELNVAAPLAVTPPLHIEFASYVDVNPVMPVTAEPEPTLSDAITRYNDLPLFIPKISIKSKLWLVASNWQEVANYTIGLAISRGKECKSLESARREVYRNAAPQTLLKLADEVEAIICPKPVKNDLKENALEAFNKHCLPFYSGDARGQLIHACDPQTIMEILQYLERVSRRGEGLPRQVLTAQIKSGMHNCDFIKPEQVTDDFWQWVLLASEVHSRVSEGVIL